jgi:hypothetical protein
MKWHHLKFVEDNAKWLKDCSVPCRLIDNIHEKNFDLLIVHEDTEKIFEYRQIHLHYKDKKIALMTTGLLILTKRTDCRIV